ncbi:hypothetical protein AVEN_267875-1 [Araneus ventricosus]|uniref:Uncharacterized protein n=1 Tax=Araneus ventricosus TaxID=182803 RepID=A0A4Y2HAD3_ARAVE|nr:hypothetical protein AVEN_267875-1 [Araneus ventricosus]
MSREFGILPISRCLLPKSELIRDFKSELITQLFSALRSLKTKFETPKSVLHRAPFSLHSTFRFYPLPQGVDLRLPFTPLDNRTHGPPTTNLPCSQWSNPTVGKVLEFPHHRSYTYVT